MAFYEPQAQAAQEPAGPDLGKVLSRRKGLLLLGLVVGLSLAYLHHVRQPVVYRSTAQILVAKKTPPALPIHGFSDRWEQEDRTNIRTQEVLVKSPLIIERAVRERRLDALPTVGRRDPVGAIAASLSVDEAEPMSDVLRLSYLSAESDDAQKVLSAVIASYQDFLGDTQQSIGEETKALIMRAKDELLKQISAKESEYRTFKQEAPLLWVEDKGTNYFQERLAKIEADRSLVLVERSKLAGLIQSIQEGLKQGRSRESILLMAGEAMEGGKALPGQNATSPLQHMLPLYVERLELMERYGPDHPKLKALNQRIELTRKFLTDHDASSAKAAAPKDFLAVYMDSLEQQLTANQSREAALNRLFDEEQQKAKALAVYEVQDQSYRNEIARIQQLFEAVVKRLEELSLIKDTGGYTVSVLSPPTQGQPVQLNLARTMILGAVLGLLAGGLLGLVRDKGSRTFYSAEEISQALQLPLVGHIPLISSAQQRKAAAQSRLDPLLYTYAMPRATASEAFRAVRTALYFSAQGRTQRVLQVTSPSPGDGKTTLASNLAITIAQSGKRVLLIDADFRKPRIHRLFHLPNDTGLASVIDGAAELDEAIQATPLEGLSVLTCGPRPHNPSELLSSPRFSELLELLREKFDFVLLDTPPMLAVTDPSTIAPRVDGVLLTLRLRNGVRPSAERAAEMVRNLGAEILGVVINGVEKGHGYRYYYGGYESYGGYRGANGKSDHGAYYDDDHAAVEANGAASKGRL